MQTLSDEEFDGLKEHVRGHMPKGPEVVNKFMSVDDGYARLLRMENKKPVSIAKDTREFSLEEPLYVRRFEVYSKEAAKTLKGLEIKVVTAAGQTKVLVGHKVESKKSDGTTEEYLLYFVKDFLEKVIVRSTMPYRKLSILRVSAIGYSLDQLENIASDISRATDTFNAIDDYVAQKKKAVDISRDEIKVANTEIAQLKESIEELSDEDSALRKKVDGAKQEEKNQADKLAKAKNSLQLAENGLQAAKNNQLQLEEQIAGLNREITQKNRELQDLISDRNLISDEYRDYVSEGKQQSKYYLLFLAVPFFVIGFCAWQLYSGAKNILQVDVASFEHLFALFLQRVPFATAIALVVAVCWKLASALIQRIMFIHGQRLTLAKLLVIAKDTVYSSAVGLDLKDEEKLRHRMLLKLEMLKSHLTNELGGGFDYRPLEVSKRPEETGSDSGTSAP